MSSYAIARARYASDAAGTVSPARLLTMLYDRLVADLAQAEEAMITGDAELAGNRVGHAQAILLELHTTLDTSVWSGADALNQVYIWVLAELMRARQHHQPERVAQCRALIEPLRDAWHAAASGQDGRAVATAVPDPAGPAGSPPRVALTGTVVPGTVGPRVVTGAA